MRSGPVLRALSAAKSAFAFPNGTSPSFAATAFETPNTVPFTDKTIKVSTRAGYPPSPIDMPTGIGESICAASRWPSASISHNADHDGCPTRMSAVPLRRQSRCLWQPPKARNRRAEGSRNSVQYRSWQQVRCGDQCVSDVDHLAVLTHRGFAQQGVGVVLGHISLAHQNALCAVDGLAVL